jgi:hypothetical protein
MLRRAASRREKQKTAEYHAALLKTRSVILKAINIDYGDVSCEMQSREFMDQTGAMPVSDSLDPREQLDSGATSQDCIVSNVTACLVETEQPDNTTGQRSRIIGQYGIFHTTSVHMTAPSESSDQAWEEDTRSIMQTHTSQDGSKNEAVVSPLPKLEQQLSLGAAAVAGRNNNCLQVDAGVHRSVSERGDDSDSTAYFSPHIPLASPVPTEHQDLNGTRASSDADKEVILKVADEVCEVEGDAEQCTEVRMYSRMVKAVRILSYCNPLK